MLKTFTMTSATPSDLTRLPYVTSKIQTLILDGNSVLMTCSVAMIESLYRMLTTFVSRSYSINTITYCQDIMVRTRHSNRSTRNMSGQDYDPLSNNFAILVSSANNQKPLVINLTDYSDHFWFWNAHGTPSLWILSNISLHQMGLP